MSCINTKGTLVAINPILKILQCYISAYENIKAGEKELIYTHLLGNPSKDRENTMENSIQVLKGEENKRMFHTHDHITYVHM